MDAEELFRRYQQLQSYVGWTDADAQRVAAVRPYLEALLPPMIDDFYAEIERHTETRRVITGGAEQIARLKGTLLKWIQELLSGQYDRDYVHRRWRVGWRHVDIGLDQRYTNAALSRLRGGLVLAIQKTWTGTVADKQETVRSLNRLLDLDLAIIEDAYQEEYANRLQRSERMATIGQVAGGVAHELRNPLNVVKTSIYYLLNARAANEEKKLEHLQRIERQVLLADSVITALTNFARLPVPNLKPVPLAACVRQTLEFTPLPPHVEVVLDLPDTLPAALADGDQLRIVLSNLIRNAREAMPKGGKLTLAGQSADGSVELLVGDTGVGIADDDLHRVMEPLFSTKARGLGLGLAIARSILEKNQGTLRVQSMPGQGSTFTVRLPAAPAAAAGEGSVP